MTKIVSMSWGKHRSSIVFAVGVLSLAMTPAPLAAQWVVQKSGTEARLRGLAVVDSQVVWASGTGGTFTVTTDAGATWRAGTVPGAAELDFRDIHATSASRAFLLSIGDGAKSRIYATADGGKTWAIRYKNEDPKVFLDAIAFWDADHGIVMGDPVEGHFTILTTEDGGVHWSRLPADRMPAARPGEGAFAASGTCLVVGGDQTAWFGTGGAEVARVFRTVDRGRTWTVHDTPIVAGTASAGVFSLAFFDQASGVAVGGDYKQPERAEKVVARTVDGGLHWTLTEGRGPGGYRSAVAVVPGAMVPTLVAAGPTGSDVSTDGGLSWKPLGTLGFHAVNSAQPVDGGWGVGDLGRVAHFHGSLR
jgi:photosystem II stability/assembly factor-like uncharacterized protein